MRKFFTPTILLFLLSCSQTKDTAIQTYHAGFKTIHFVDSARIYKPNTDATNYLHYRPVDIDVWYPADSSATDTALFVRNLLSLFEERANYYTASNIGNGITAQTAQLFCNGFKCSDSLKLLGFKTNSFKNAAAINGKFPLVVYLTAFNGMSYENFSLFETLAEKGFVVVSISSIGRYPGDMTMKKQDLAEQVNDAVVAVNYLKQNSNIDSNNIGIVGYSWGGLAGVMLANRISASCVISLDGSEFHHYGNAKDENADFDTIKNSDDFKNIHLTIPYLRLESSPITQTEKIDSVYNFAATHTDKPKIFSIDSAEHEDFSCMSLVVKKSGNCKTDERFPTISKLTVSFLEEYLADKNTFSQTVQEEINRTIKKK